MKRSTLRGLAIGLAKAAVSAGLIALALRGIDSGTVLRNLKGVDASAVAIAVLVVTTISLFHARRWQVVLERMAHRLAFGDSLSLVLIGYFFNQTLPSTVGGDAFRAWGAYKAGIRVSDAVTSVVVDRILALASLVIMIVLGLWWLLDILRLPAERAIVGLVIVACAAGMVVLLSLARFGERLRRWRLSRYLLQLSESSLTVTSSSAAMLQVVLLTVIGYAMLSYAVHVLARGMGVDLGLGNSLLLVPLVTLVTVLPVSIAGWGLRESAMVVALGLIGVPSVQAFSLSILFGLVVMASGIPGGILWLVTRRQRNTPQEAAAS